MNWKKFDHAIPCPVVAGFAYDDRGRFLMLHRSDKVRSAPNCWSTPSGLHEIGETQAQCFARELEEEFALEANPSTFDQVGVYENVPGDGWHWVITHATIRVKTFGTLVNREPEKHDDFVILPAASLLNPERLLQGYPVHRSAEDWYRRESGRVFQSIRRGLG